MNIKYANGKIKMISILHIILLSNKANLLYDRTKKPFNPLLGEIYEIISEEKNFRFYI